MSTPIVEVKHLSHRYSVDWAIRDINFSIEKTKMLLYNYKMKRYIVNRKNINRKRSNDGIKRKRTNKRKKEKYANLFCT